MSKFTGVMVVVGLCLLAGVLVAVLMNISNEKDLQEEFSRGFDVGSGVSLGAVSMEPPETIIANLNELYGDENYSYRVVDNITTNITYYYHYYKGFDGEEHQERRNCMVNVTIIAIADECGVEFLYAQYKV